MPASKADLPVVAFPRQVDWNAWLARQPKASLGGWVKFAKKTSAASTVSKQEAIDAALCHGWIDGELDRFDLDHFLIRFTARMARSSWSQISRICALALMAQGRLQPAGLANIGRAKADAAGMPPRLHSVTPSSLATSKRHWTPTRMPPASSPPSTASTARPSSIACTRQETGRNAPASRRNSSTCSSVATRSIRWRNAAYDVIPGRAEDKRTLCRS